MTSEQRELLRKAIDAQMRERVERGRNAKAQAKQADLERPRLEEAVASLPDDVDVEVVTVGAEGVGEDHRREALSEARMARRRLQKVRDEAPSSRPVRA